MKKIIFILFLAFTTQLHSYQYRKDATFAFADLLVWRLREGGADNWAQMITPAGTYRTAKIVNVPFNWHAGFRIGVGYNSCCDDYDAILYYTNYSTDGVNQATADVFSAFLGNFFVNNTAGANFGPTYHDASIHWKFWFNTVDLELGHTFKIDPILKLRPFIGLKTAFINQDINTNWQNPTTPTTFTSASEDLKNDFWGIGPSIGINTTWPIYTVPQNSLDIFGNFSGALLWGHWHFKDLYTNNTPTSIAINSSNINGASPMARALLGIQYAGYISRAHMTIRLGYEAQVWFNQLQFYSLNMGRLNNLMSLQGGILDFCVNF